MLIASASKVKLSLFIARNAVLNNEMHIDIFCKLNRNIVQGYLFYWFKTGGFKWVLPPTSEGGCFEFLSEEC